MSKYMSNWDKEIEVLMQEGKAWACIHCGANVRLGESHSCANDWESAIDKVINRPAHYVDGRSIEPADAIIDWQLSWALGNAVKYLSRCGRKGDAVEDLRKAIWYIEREIVRLGGKK